MSTFPNIYWYVEFKKASGNWNLPPHPESTAIPTASRFAFATIPREHAHYGTSSIRVYDEDVQIKGLDHSFDSRPWMNPLARIGDVTIDIDNLEMFYHRLVELNGNDRATLYGATMKVYQANGFIPGLKWTGSEWQDFDGVTASPQPAPPATYFSTDVAQLLFSGTVEAPASSVMRTSISSSEENAKRNVLLGTLADANAQDRDKGLIIPIQYGDQTDERALAPVVLDRTIREVPKVLLDTEALHTMDAIVIFDKESERHFEVQNKQSVNSDNNEVTMVDESGSESLGEGNGGDDLLKLTDSAKNTLQLNSNDSQIIFRLNDELIGWHGFYLKYKTWEGTFWGEDQRHLASRGWADSEKQDHDGGDVYDEVDADIIATRARINIELIPVGLALEDTGGTGVVLFEEAVFPEIGQDLDMDDLSYSRGNTWGAASGSVWDMIKNSRDGDEDLLNHPKFNANAPIKDHLDAGLGFGTALMLRLIPFWERVGLEGDIQEITGFVRANYHPIDVTVDVNPQGNLKVFRYVSINPDDATERRIDFNVAYTLDSDNLIDYDDTEQDESLRQNFGTNIGTLSNLYDNATRLEFSVITEFADKTATPNIGFLYLHAMKLQVQVLVDAVPKLWFAKLKGRKFSGGSLIENPHQVIENLLETELGYTGSVFKSGSRSSWKFAGSIFGKRPKAREVIRQMAFECGSLSFVTQSTTGDVENLATMEKRTVDKTVVLDDLLLRGNLVDLDYSYTPRSELYSRVEVKYQKINPTGDFGAVISADGLSITSTNDLSYLTGTRAFELKLALENAWKALGFGTTLSADSQHNTLSVESHFIRDDSTAQRFLEHLVTWSHSIKALVTMRGHYDAFYDVELGDQHKLSLGGQVPQAITDAQFIVIGKRVDQRDGITLKLIEIPEI